MTKPAHQQLAQYLLDNLKGLVKSNDIDAWQEEGELMLNPSDLGNGFQVAKWKYKAVISIEKFPHRKTNPYNLLALLACYLVEHGEERDTYELKDPTIDIDVQSKDSSEIEITAWLIDEIEIVPDPSGSIVFMGERYRVDMVPVDIAENAEFEQATA